MGMATGISPINDYTGLTSDAAVQKLLDTLPNPEVSPATARTGTAHGAGFLDEISPPALTQIRVELESIIALTS